MFSLINERYSKTNLSQRQVRTLGIPALAVALGAGPKSIWVAPAAAVEELVADTRGVVVGEPRLVVVTLALVLRHETILCEEERNTFVIYQN